MEITSWCTMYIQWYIYQNRHWLLAVWMLAVHSHSKNYLGKLKRLVRSGRRPLVQVVKRLVERPNSPLSMVTSKSKINRPNNAFILAEGHCCEAIEEREVDGSQMLLCKVFEKTEPLFRDPCDSRILGCFKAQSRHSVMKLIPEWQLTRNAIMVERRQEMIFLAILHEH